MRNVALTLVLLLVSPALAQDAFSDHYGRAVQLSEADQHLEALKAFEAAWAVRQLPKLLLMIARTHQRLGHAREALDHYQRYLVAERTIEPELRAEIDRDMAHLRTIVEPARPAPPTPPAPGPRLGLGGTDGVHLVPVRYVLRADRGLIGGGAALLASGYVAATIAGSLFLTIGDSSNDSSGSLSTAGGVLLIPVLGPFISAFIYRNPTWALNWTLVDGAAQVAGLAMIIAGARSKHKVPVFSEKLKMLPYASSQGGGLTVTGRF